MFSRRFENFDRDVSVALLPIEVPLKFQSDGTILNTNLAASRLHGISR